MDNFDIKKYLVENKVTRNSRLNEDNYDTANNVMAIINQLIEMGNEGERVLTILERIPEWNELVSDNQDIDGLNEAEAPQGDETAKDEKPVPSGIAMISKDLEGQESAFKSIRDKEKMEQFLDMIASKLDPKFKESSAFKQAFLSFIKKINK